MAAQHAADLQPGLDGAFMADGYGVAPPAQRHSTDLAGLRLAVKDVFEVAGLRMGAGNPTWLRDSVPARHSAPAVRLLLEAGAQWVGKTVTDELTYSLAGQNAHYGAPRNPAAADRYAGGSSSGSAVAVAAGHADIALGTDCGGSVRLPASYCGLWGMRPTHGRIATDGCITLAHSFDTVGWLASDGAVLGRVFNVLAHAEDGDHGAAGAADFGAFNDLIVPQFVLALLAPPVRARFEALLQRLCRHAAVTPVLSDPAQIGQWATAFRTLQAGEAWQQHGAWLTRPGAGTGLGADVRQRFEAAETVTRADVAAAQRVRIQAMATLAQLLAPGTLMLLPTVPGGAPRLDAAPAELEQVRRQAQTMLCLAGLAGLPQVSFPWMQDAAAPLGLSLIGARGADAAVLAAATALHAAFIAAH